MLTETSLDQVAVGLVRRAEENLRRDGHLVSAVQGLDRSGQLVLSVVSAGDEPQVIAEQNMLALPGPLRDWAPTIKEAFTANGVVAAAMISEYWSFPEGDTESTERLLAGDGPLPSQHERRQEGILVLTTWPLGGYMRTDSRRIARTPSGAYTRLWDRPERNLFREGAGCDPASLAWKMATSWLEECLPARGQTDQRRRRSCPQGGGSDRRARA